MATLEAQMERALGMLEQITSVTCRGNQSLASGQGSSHRRSPKALFPASVSTACVVRACLMSGNRSTRH